MWRSFWEGNSVCLCAYLVIYSNGLFKVSLYAVLRINGHPGNYVRIAGKWRLEEVRLTQE